VSFSRNWTLQFMLHLHHGHVGFQISRDAFPVMCEALFARVG
jgi:hypothetical protein